MNSETEIEENNQQINIVPEIIKEIIENSLNSIFDRSQYEYALKYDPSINPEEPYMKRKLSQIRNDVLNSFGSSNLELKKSYSKIELEKIELKKKLIQEQNAKEELVQKNYVVSNRNVSTSNDFMSDAKIHKSKLEHDKEYSVMMQKMIGNKRNSSDEFINSNKKSDEANDWTSLMATSIKKKSRIEIEKEKFLEETKKRKEEQLKNITNLSKSQVFKFDENIIGKKDTEISKNYENNKNILNIETDSGAVRICQVCKSVIENKSNIKRISTKCEHYLHYVFIFLIIKLIYF
jgi:hypothetical protein